jgi:hypothetical protein
MITRKTKIDTGKKTGGIMTEETGEVMKKKIEKGVGVGVIKNIDFYKHLSRFFSINKPYSSSYFYHKLLFSFSINKYK